MNEFLLLAVVIIYIVINQPTSIVGQ
jgi:hypothetical protein